MSQIEGGRWDGIARKLFNISAPVAVPNLSDEVIPTFEIQNWEPELYVLRRERLLFGSTATGAVAGEFSHVGITNPPDSGVLIIIEQVELAGVPDLIWFAAIEPEQLTTALGWTEVAYGNRDFRWPGGAVPTATLATARFVSLNTAVAQGEIVSTGTINSDSSTLPRRFPVVLTPNTGLIFRPSAQAVQMRAAMFWRERPFNPQERP